MFRKKWYFDQYLQNVLLTPGVVGAVVVGEVHNPHVFSHCFCTLGLLHLFLCLSQNAWEPVSLHSWFLKKQVIVFKEMILWPVSTICIAYISAQSTCLLTSFDYIGIITSIVFPLFFTECLTFFIYAFVSVHLIKRNNRF